MLIANGEFDDKPFGSRMELLPVPSDPPSTSAQPFTIPVWTEEERRRASAEIVEADQPALTALETMWGAAAAAGELDDDRPIPGPPLHIEPLERFQGEPVDWQAEERDAIQRNRRERLAQARQVIAEAAAEKGAA
jgi:hypothetical protein